MNTPKKPSAMKRAFFVLVGLGGWMAAAFIGLTAATFNKPASECPPQIFVPQK